VRTNTRYCVPQYRLVGECVFSDFPGRMARKLKIDGQGGNHSKKPVTSEVSPAIISISEPHQSNPSHPLLCNPPVTSIGHSSAICQVYCSCRSESTHPMVGCDGACEEGYHCDCVGLTASAPPIGDWYCPTCILKMKVFAQSPLTSHLDIRFMAGG
jgi:hypothetical protein